MDRFTGTLRWVWRRLRGKKKHQNSSLGDWEINKLTGVVRRSPLNRNCEAEGAPAGAQGPWAHSDDQQAGAAAVPGCSPTVRRAGGFPAAKTVRFASCANRKVSEEPKSKGERRRLLSDKRVAQLEAELFNVVDRKRVTEALLKSSARQCEHLQQENTLLKKDLAETQVQVRELSDKLDSEFKKRVQLEGVTEELRQIVDLLVEQLEAVRLDAGSPVQGSTQEPKEERREQQDLSLFSQAQAAAADKPNEVNTTRELMEKRIHALESELEQVWSQQEEAAMKLKDVEAEIQSYDNQYSLSMDMIKLLTMKLEETQEMLAEAGVTGKGEHANITGHGLEDGGGCSRNPSGSAPDETKQAEDSLRMSPAMLPNWSHDRKPLPGHCHQAAHMSQEDSDKELESSCDQDLSHEEDEVVQPVLDIMAQ